MPIERLSDPEDSRLAPFRDLKRTNATRDSNVFVAEGEKLVERMIEVGWPIANVLLSETHLERFRRRLPPDVMTFVVPPAVIEEVIGFNFHRGILACGRRPTNQPIAEWIPPVGQDCRLLLIVDVRDPENLGTIIRTAAAFGLAGVILSDQCADPFSRRVLRTSMGAVLHIRLSIVSDPAMTINELAQDHGVEVVATVLDPEAVPLATIRVGARNCLAIGNEGDGLPQACIDAATSKVTIPMASGTDSLNVAVATGIMLYRFSPPAE